MGCISNWTSTSYNKQGKVPEWGNCPFLQVASGHVGRRAWRSLRGKAQSSAHGQDEGWPLKDGHSLPSPTQEGCWAYITASAVRATHQRSPCKLIIDFMFNYMPKNCLKIDVPKKNKTKNHSKKTSSNFALTILITKNPPKTVSWINKPLPTWIKEQYLDSSSTCRRNLANLMFSNQFGMCYENNASGKVAF